MITETALFGGSFNPIHTGHLALANYLCEYTSLDELWFMVSPQNPLKRDEELLPEELRLKMVEAAIGDYGKFKASDFEFHLPRPSYTIQTLDKLKESYPARRFHLVIGSDNWQLFPKWREGKRLIAENPIIIYPRPGYTINPRTLPANIRFIDAPLLDISSTFIRRALKAKRDVRYFLHPETYKLLMAFLHLK